MSLLDVLKTWTESEQSRVFGKSFHKIACKKKPTENLNRRYKAGGLPLGSKDYSFGSGSTTHT